MADPKTFTLIGEFKDGITPELAKINRQLSSLKKSFDNFGGKGARSAARDTGRFSAAVSSLNENLKTQNQSLRAAVAPMREYRREVGKTVGALTRLNLAASGAKGIEATNDALRQQIRLQKELRSASMYGYSPRRRGAPAAGSIGGVGAAARPGSGRSRRGHGGITGGGFSMAEFGFSYTLGNSIAQPIQNAITTGFEIGVGLMMKPFEFFAGAFGERVRDELSDLKAAGGLYSISKRSKNPFLKDMDDAIEFQQDTNRAFAEMAASLPGVTNDYVQVGKRLSDTIARIVSQDFEKAKAKAIQIRSTAEGQKFYGGEITGDMATQQKEVMKTLLGEMTKKTTIAGLGGTRSAGGITGAYGLPGIMERIMSEDQVSMGKFQRYASIFSDPTIADALKRNIDKINATAANTVARNDAVEKLLDEVVTPELIEKLRTSFDGMYQELKAAFFDPDKGLFGLGRQFKDLGRKINQYGEYVDEFGNVVDDVNKAAPASLSIFEMVRDIFANFGQALIPIVDILPQIFDPLRSVGRILAQVRHYAAEFNRQFNYYRQGFIDLAKTPGMKFLKGTEDIRATLLTIANFMRNFKVIGEGDFTRVRDILKTENADFPKILSGLIDTLMNSEMATSIGSYIGQIIGTVLVEVAKLTGFISGRIKKGNKLFAGIKKGFDDVGGGEAFKNIFQDVFKSLIKVLYEVLKVIPFEAYMIGGILLAMPALIQGLSMWLATSLLKIPGKLMSGGMSGLLAEGTAKGVIPTGAQAKNVGSAFLPAYGADAAAGLRKNLGKTRLGKFFSDVKRSFGTTGYSEPIGPTPRGKTGQAVNGGYLPSKAMKGRGAGVAAMGGKLASGLKGAVGPAALVMGGIDAAIRMGAGEDAGRAIGGAAATTVGSTIGGILGQTLIPIPGVGAALGGIAGGIIGDKLFSVLAGPTAEQQKAANLQMQAALQQKQAAGMNKAGIDTEKAGGTFLFGQADELSKRLNELGLSTSAAVRSFEGLYRLDQSKQAAALKAKEALDAEVERLAALGRPEKEIANSVKGLQDTYDIAAGEAEASLTALNTAWRKLGPETSKVITDSFRAMPVGQVEAAIAERIRAARIHSRLTQPGRGNQSSVDIVGRAKGGLSDAISSEMRNKPAGSKLVVANSSETVIPAAGGYGMKNFLNQVTMAVASSNRSTLGGGRLTVNAPITIYQTEGQDSEQLAAAVIGRLREAVDNAQRTTFG